MAKKKREAHAGGHGWFVTFADLMGLLVSFFVMMVAFSKQDSAQMQLVAGSMREAFGTQDKVRHAGILEINGVPNRPKLKNVDNISPEESSDTPTPDERDRQRNQGTRLRVDQGFALASASLRQAMQDLPEVAEISKNVMFEETKEGLNIELIDQDGRSMFNEGSKEPLERTKRLIQKLSIPLRGMPYRIAVAGHTASTRTVSKPGYGPWELSSDRANAVRRILEGEGIPGGHFVMITGRADTLPLFPDDPYIAANRRVTITLMREEPPIPASHKP